MSPHTEDLDGVGFGEELVDEAVLNVDAARVGAGEVADEFFVGRRILVRVGLQDAQKQLGLGAQAGGLEFSGILARLGGVEDGPGYHGDLLEHLPAGVFIPLRMDCRIPGIESR